MGAGAAGCAMDPPRLLLLLLGVSASRRGAALSPWTGTLRGSGFPEGKQDPAPGSQMLRMDDGRGAPMPAPRGERLGFSGRRGDPEIQGRDAEQRCARMRVLPYLGVWVWRSWEGLRGGGPAARGAGVLCKRTLECQDLGGGLQRGGVHPEIIQGDSPPTPPSILISGGSWDRAQDREGRGVPGGPGR